MRGNMIAIIPARGGSKGLPGKNIKLLNGKPLIAYAIEAAKKAKNIEEVYVTTDSEEIARVARNYKAEVPFLRPAELSSDTSSAVDVYLHSAEYLNKYLYKEISKFMVLLPTAPFRHEGHIDEAICLFQERQAQTLISVSEAEIPISWYLQKNKEGYLLQNNQFQEKLMANRQINETYYIPNGAIYILDYDLLKEKRTYYGAKTIPYIMGRKESIDIDTIDDFEYAEYMIQKNNPV